VPAPDFSPGERVFKPAEKALVYKLRALALVAGRPGRHAHQYHDVMSSESFLSSAAGSLVPARNG